MHRQAGMPIGLTPTTPPAWLHAVDAAAATHQLVVENEEGLGSSSSLAGEIQQARQQQQHHHHHQGDIPDATPTKATTTKTTTTEGTEAAAAPPPAASCPSAPPAASCPSAPAAIMVDTVASPTEEEEEADDDHAAAAAGQHHDDGGSDDSGCSRDHHHHPELSTPAPSVLRTLMAHAAEVVRIGMGASPIQPLDEESGGDIDESGDDGQQQDADEQEEGEQQQEAEQGGTADPLLDITMQPPQRVEEQDDETWRQLRGPWDDDPEAVSSRGQLHGEEARAQQPLMGTELSFSTEGAGGSEGCAEPHLGRQQGRRRHHRARG